MYHQDPLRRAKRNNIMAIRFEFRNEVIAKQAKNDCFNLGYWGKILYSGKSEKAACILECHEDMAGTIETRFANDIL